MAASKEIAHYFQTQFIVVAVNRDEPGINLQPLEDRSGWPNYAPLLDDKDFVRFCRFRFEANDGKAEFGIWIEKQVRRLRGKLVMPGKLYVEMIERIYSDYLSEPKAYTHRMN